jgi:hypothetical protein
MAICAGVNKLYGLRPLKLRAALLVILYVWGRCRLALSQPVKLVGSNCFTIACVQCYRHYASPGYLLELGVKAEFALVGAHFRVESTMRLSVRELFVFTRHELCTVIP